MRFSDNASPTEQIVRPEDIKVTDIPLKNFYDFTKGSQNYKLMKSGPKMNNNGKYDFEQRCDSKLTPDDLP